MATSERFPRTWAAIRAEFPGKANAGLRGKMLRMLEDGNDVSSLCRRIAFTACGEASVLEVARVQREEDPRLQLVEATPEDYEAYERGERID